MSLLTSSKGLAVKKGVISGYNTDDSWCYAR